MPRGARRVHARAFPLLFLALAAVPLAAQAQANRCEEGGRIVYRNTPCAGAPPAIERGRPAEPTLLDGALRLQLPAGYTRLSAEEIGIKFPKTGRPPFAAFADARRNATIAFTLSRSERPFSEEQLPEFLAAMQDLMPRLMPGLVWLGHEVLTIEGRKWARMRLSTRAADADLRNDMYFTPLRGEILGVNLTATVGVWPAAEPVLAQALRAIRFR